jgi:hypothetical protein
LNINSFHLLRPQLKFKETYAKFSKFPKKSQTSSSSRYVPKIQTPRSRGRLNFPGSPTANHRVSPWNFLNLLPYQSLSILPYQKFEFEKAPQFPAIPARPPLSPGLVVKSIRVWLSCSSFFLCNKERQS